MRLGWIRELSHWAAKRRVIVVTCAFVLLGLSFVIIPRLRLQSGIYELFPDRPGPIRDLARYSQLFGASEELVVLISGKEPSAVAWAARRIAAELQRSPLIGRVHAGVQGIGLTAALGRSLLLLAGPDSWPRVTNRLTSELPMQVRRLRRLLLSPLTPPRGILEQDPLALTELLLEGGSRIDRRTGLYTNQDGRAALIFVRPLGRVSDHAFCKILLQELGELRKRLLRDLDQPGLRIQFSGGYAYAYHLAILLRGDLTLSGTLAMLGAVLLLAIAFRSLRLIPLAVITSSVAVLTTLAIATLTVGQLNALSLSFTALCIGMGLDALIHIAMHAHRFCGPSRLIHTLESIGPALVAATLTTISAFLTFGLTSFAGLAHTGLLAACGLSLTLVLTLILVPALASLVPRLPSSPKPSLLDRSLGWWAKVMRHYRGYIIFLAICSAGLALWGATDLRFSGDLTRLVPQTLPPSRTDRDIARLFERERNRVIVLLQGSDYEKVLQANDQLALHLSAMQKKGQLVSFRSISKLLPSLATQEGRRARLTALQPIRLVETIKKSFATSGLQVAAFEPFYRSLLDPRPMTRERIPAGIMPLVNKQLVQRDGQTIVATTLYLFPSSDATDFARQLKKLVGGWGVKRDPTDVTISLTGATFASAEMERLLEEDMLLVCCLTSGIVLCVLGMLLKRLWPMVAALLSLLLSGLVFIAALSWLGLSIDLYNLMVLPILIGYGVDDHIYVVQHAQKKGLGCAIVESGRAVLLTTLTSIVAFGALCLCSLPGLRVLGITAVIGLCVGLLGSLVVMPAILALGRSPHKDRSEYNGDL